MSAWASFAEEFARALAEGKGDVGERIAELRGEASGRGTQVLDDVKRHGAELAALAARHGIELARDYGIPLATGRRRRSRGAPVLRWALAAVAVAALAAVIAAAFED